MKRSSEPMDDPPVPPIAEAGEVDFDDDLPGLSSQEREDRTAVENAAELGGVQAQIALEEDSEELRTLAALEAVRQLEHAEEIEWRISRQGSEDPKLNGFLETWPSSSMTLERLRDKFGGGKYYLHGMRRGRYFQHKTIVVAGDAIRRNQPSANVDQNQTQGMNLQDFFLRQREEDERRRREREEADERRRRDDDERDERRTQRMLAMVTAVGTVAGPIVSALIGRKDSNAELLAALAPKPQDPLALIRMMKELKELDRPAQAPEDAFERAFGFLERVKDILPGAGGSELSWLDVARTAIQTLGPGIGQGVQSLLEQAAVAKSLEAQRAAQARPLLPAGASSPAAPPSLPAPSSTAPAPLSAASGAQPAPGSARTAGVPFAAGGATEDEAMLKLLPLLSWFKGETERLIVAAARGSDPQLRAEVMFDDMPDGADLEAIGQVLAREDWMTLFKSLDARVGEYPDFFQSVRRALLAIIAEETGIAFPARDPAGIDPASGARVVSVQGPGETGEVREASAQAPPAPARGRRDPNAPIERPGPLPPLTGELFNEGEEADGS